MFSSSRTYLFLDKRLFNALRMLIFVLGIGALNTAIAFACHHTNASNEESSSYKDTESLTGKTWSLELSFDNSLGNSIQIGSEIVSIQNKNCCDDMPHCDGPSMCECSIPYTSHPHKAVIHTISLLAPPTIVQTSRAPPISDRLLPQTKDTPPFLSETLYLAFDQWLL